MTTDEGSQRENKSFTGPVTTQHVGHVQLLRAQPSGRKQATFALTTRNNAIGLASADLKVTGSPDQIPQTAGINLQINLTFYPADYSCCASSLTRHRSTQNQQLHYRNLRV